MREILLSFSMDTTRWPPSIHTMSDLRLRWEAHTACTGGWLFKGSYIPYCRLNILWSKIFSVREMSEMGGQNIGYYSDAPGRELSRFGQTFFKIFWHLVLPNISTYTYTNIISFLISGAAGVSRTEILIWKEKIALSLTLTSQSMWFLCSVIVFPIWYRCKKLKASSLASVIN